MDPITLEAIDVSGTRLFSFKVASSLKVSVQSILDRAFVENQTTQNPDPIHFTLSYFGYSKSPGFPGYLGYEIESIGSSVADATQYWELLVNGRPSDHGIDTTYPAPGDTVIFQLVQITSAIAVSDSRRAAVIARRASR